MNRRNFIKLAMATGATITVLPGCIFDSSRPVAPAKNKSENGQVQGEVKAKMAIASGDDVESLVKKGFAAMGGIGSFIKSGSLVTIKPNFSSTRGPDSGVTTNPLLVGAVVKQCLEAGAKEVRVIDHTFYAGELCLRMSGMEAAVRKAGGKAYTINSQTGEFYSSVNINGTILKTADYAKDVLDADVFINMPILKQCDPTGISAGLKNLMGIVWDRNIFHQTDLHQTIAELSAFKKPTLTIMDALKGITANGPSGPGPIQEWKQVVFSTDMLAADAYGASLLGMKAADIKHLAIASKLGVGNLDWNRIEVLKA